MAPKTPEDVEVVKANVSLKKAQAICGVINTAIIALAFTACFLGACWATVEIVRKPPWVEITVAIITALGGQALVIWRLYIALRLKVDRTEAEQGGPLETPVGPGGRESA